MSVSVPKLELLLKQEAPPDQQYFHMVEMPLEERMQFCRDCGDVMPEMADVYVSQNPPMRSKEPLCARHANLAHAEWILNL